MRRQIWQFWRKKDLQLSRRKESLKKDKNKEKNYFSYQELGSGTY